MASSRSYEKKKLLIALRSEDLDLCFSTLGSYPWFFPLLKHGDDNRGSHAIQRHFVLHCEVTLPIAYKFQQMRAETQMNKIEWSTIT